MSKKKRVKTYKHSGDLGDIIFSLPTIRAQGAGVLYLDPKGGEEEELVRWGNGTHTHTKLTEKSIESIKELLEFQDYIKEVRLWDGEVVDFNLDKFRHHNKYNNLADAHLAAFAVSFEERDKAWLKVPSMIADDESRDVIIARSCRYHGNYTFWETFDRDMIEKATYLGFEKEFEYFKYTYPHFEGVPRREVQSVLEMAQVIAGADLFIGNQGLPHALAEALKKPLINEVFRPYPAAVFHREDAKYV